MTAPRRDGIATAARKIEPGRIDASRGPHVQSTILYIAAALAEIAGCFAFWAWLRMSRSSLWLVPGCLSLIAFAWLLTRVDAADAGRAYAAYGGIYITAAVIWLWVVEGIRPDRWDIGGTALCLIGAAVIFFGPHRA